MVQKLFVIQKRQEAKRFLFPLPLAGEGALAKPRRVGALSADSHAERAPTPTLPRKRGRGGAAADAVL